MNPIDYYRPYYPRFSNAEYQRRYRLVREQMAAHGIDCLVVTGSPGMNAELMADVHWLSNWNHTAAPGFVVFPYHGDPSLYFGLVTYRSNAGQRSVIEDVRPGTSVARRIHELGLGSGTIGIVGSFPHEVLAELKEDAPQARVVSAGEWFGEIRRVRSAEEIEWLRKGARFADIGLEAMIKAIRPGVTERQLYAATMHAVFDAGGQFCFQWLGSTPMATPLMAYPTQAPSDRVIEKGDIIITEIAASYEWYAGQINRYVAVGQEPPEEYRRLHQHTVHLVKDVCASLKPGAVAAEVARAAEPLLKAGYHLEVMAIGRPTGGSTPPVLPVTPPGEFFQRPFLQDETVMVLPLTYKEPDRLGLFLGDLVLVTPEGGKSLHGYPLEEFRVV
ncbi:aminopeptidase P family protein [bacterium]|nr:MAG: aminopeptidase P family protein [bacterium]MCL4232197.1 M24 family metallopeptidase [Dehalococcoidia bacterium]